MTEERMHFSDSTEEPNIMYLAEHVVRYAALASLVSGRRVLDIACGEGYGSWLLKEWGATSVLGVDVSAEAVQVAQRQFGREGVHYLAADACSVAEKLTPGSFDLIACFETLEHLEEPERFLAGLRTLAAPGAQIFISCPNDHVSLPPDQSNPFHLRKYTFEEFQACCEAVLGPAADWMLGVNVQGYGLVSEGAAQIRDESRGAAEIIMASKPGTAHLLPSQRSICPNRCNVLYYLGVWGMAPAALPVVVSGQSYQAFIEPWQALEWFKADRERLQRQHELATAELADTRRQIVALHGVIARLGSDARSRGSAEHILSELKAPVKASIRSISRRLARGLRGAGRLLRGKFGDVKESLLARRRGRKSP